MNPLLLPLSEEQRTVLALLEQTYRHRRVWPPWQFVEGTLEARQIEATEVISALPQVGRTQGIYGLSYGLTWTRGSPGIALQPADPVGLTVVGFYRAGAFDVVDIFLAVLAMGCSKLRTTKLDPERVVPLELTSDEVFAELFANHDEMPILSAPELYELLEHEPAMWTGGRSLSPDGAWRWEMTRAIRQYESVRTIDEYVEVVTRLAEESGRQVAATIPFASSIASPPAIQPQAPSIPIVMMKEPSFYSPQVPLLGNAIDRELWEFVRPLVEHGRWEQVAREAAAFVEIRAREWTGSKRAILDLLQELLSPPKSIDRERASDYAEQEGWHLLARGFFGAVRNHVMHNSVGTEEELQYGLGALGTASLLVRRLRSSIATRSTPAPEAAKEG